MRFELIDAEKAHFPVSVLCEVLEVSRSGYYAWKDRAPSPREVADAALAVEVAATHARSKNRYGSPRVHRALRKRGVRVGCKRVARLMRKQGLVAKQKRRYRRTTDSKHAYPIAPNVLERDFRPEAPNEAWAGDVTYIHTAEGWAYLAVLLDLYSRRVVGWALSDANDTKLALDVLERAVSSRGVHRGLVQHTDRGSPYASAEYRRALDQHGIVASMSRTGDCWDNAVAESFFATLRAELVDHESYATREAAERALREYIECFYNLERLHSFLDYVSPVEFELKSRLHAIAA